MLHIESEYSEFQNQYEKLSEKIENADLFEDDNYERLKKEVEDFRKKVSNRKRSLWNDRRRSDDEEIERKHKKFCELSSKARHLRIELLREHSSRLGDQVDSLNKLIETF